MCFDENEACQFYLRHFATDMQRVSRYHLRFTFKLTEIRCWGDHNPTCKWLSASCRLLDLLVSSIEPHSFWLKILRGLRLKFCEGKGTVWGPEMPFWGLSQGSVRQEHNCVTCIRFDSQTYLIDIPSSTPEGTDTPCWTFHHYQPFYIRSCCDSSYSLRLPLPRVFGCLKPQKWWDYCWVLPHFMGSTHKSLVSGRSACVDSCSRFRGQFSKTEFAKATISERVSEADFCALACQFCVFSPFWSFFGV